MDKIKENNLYLRILKFGESHPKGFTYEQIRSSIDPQDWEDKILKIYLFNAVLNNNPYNKVLHETVFIVNKIDVNKPDFKTSSATVVDLDWKSEEEKINDALNKVLFIIKYDAYFNYIDYLELQKAIDNSNEANKHAKEAKWFAIGSILIAVITGAFQISKDSLLLNWIYNFF